MMMHSSDVDFSFLLFLKGDEEEETSMLLCVCVSSSLRCVDLLFLHVYIYTIVERW